MSSANPSTDIPLPDPDRMQKAAEAWLERVKERRGFYTALGLLVVFVVVGVLIFVNLGPSEKPSAFTPLWTKCLAVRAKLDVNASAAAELAQLEGHLEKLRGEKEEGLALWFLALYQYREAWTAEKSSAGDRRPHLDKALAYLDELKAEKYDDLLVAKGQWFVSAAQSPIDRLTAQVKSDIAWLEANEQPPPKPADDVVVVLRTSEGDIHIQLYKELAPKLSKNFVTLATTGAYNGTAFHFIRSGPNGPIGLMGGDPFTFFYPDPLKKKHILRWGQGSVGYDIPPEEARFKLNHVRGVVTSQMRDRGDWNNGIQFQIMLGNDPSLDRRHTPFGRVVEGMDVVDKCAAKKTAAEHGPYQEDSAFASATARGLVVEPARIHKAIVFENRRAITHSYDLDPQEKSLDTLKDAPAKPLPADKIYGGRLMRHAREPGDVARGLHVPFPEDVGDKPDPKGERPSEDG